ncbi:MAG: hypothetical protein ACOC2L_02110 [Candidatus Sumerlaeota bacterium]
MKRFFLKLYKTLPTLLITAMLSVPALAQDNQAMSFDVLGGLDMEFDGECQIEIDENSGEVTNLKVTDNVSLNIESNDLALDCDLLLLDADKEILIATGKKVEVVTQGRYITCQRLEYDLADNRFVLTGKPVIEQKDAEGNTTMKMRAEEIEFVNKNGKIKMFMKKGRVDASDNTGDGASSPVGNLGAGSESDDDEEDKPKPTPEPTPTPTKTPSPSSKTPTVSE